MLHRRSDKEKISNSESGAGVVVGNSRPDLPSHRLSKIAVQ